jgi:sugar O-acyltransferase (sialic acid O-acetyltransferase NeuD family)
VAKLVLFGAGDIARLARYYFSTDSEHDVVAFTVDAAYRTADQFEELPLVAVEEVAARYPPPDFKMFVALSYTGMNRVRAEKYAQMKTLGYDLVSYVSSRCSYLSPYQPGDNCFILEDNTIQPFVRIGNDVTLWSGNHIGHDSTIGDHCFISSHVVVSGHVDIGPSCFIGVNATLRNSISIAERTLIGAGAVIMKNTRPGSVYPGPRAERIPRTSDQMDL